LICFHSQQAAEKYLKAILQELGLAIPRTHDLGDLLDRLVPHDATLRPLRRGVLFLKQFAVEYRYPGENATRRQAQAAIRWAEQVRRESRDRLGLKP
jgi:HEPN domain-containing protein